MTAEQFLKDTFIEKNGFVHRDRVECADGFSISI